MNNYRKKPAGELSRTPTKPAIGKPIVKACIMNKITAFCHPVFLLLIFSLYSRPVNAQSGAGGVVTDAGTGRPLGGAYVLVETTTGKIIHATITDAKGKFEFRNMAGDSLMLKIRFVGYRSLTRNLYLNGTYKDLGALSLEPEEAEIGEVTISGKIPMAIQVGDTTQYHAAAFKTAPDATAEELVTKMPGISLVEGRLQAQGEDVREVLVDGRPFFGQDPMATLRNLPAEIIDKIQVYDRLSEQAEFTGFDDGVTSKTMNVITRMEMRNGTFGRGAAGYGTENTYLAGGNVNFFNSARRLSLVGQTNNVNRQNFSSEDLLGVMSSKIRDMRGLSRFAGKSKGGGKGLAAAGGGTVLSSGTLMSDFLVARQPGITRTHSFGVNYSDEWGKKINVTGSYFFNMSDNRSESRLFREYIETSDRSRNYTELEESNRNNINHRINFRFDYQIDSANSITFIPRLTLQQNSGSSLLQGETRLEEMLLNSTVNRTLSDLKASNFWGSLLFRHRFPKRGRTLSVNLTTALNGSSGKYEQYAENVYDPEKEPEIIDQQSLTDNPGTSLSGNVVYTEPLGSTGLLQMNYRFGMRPATREKLSYRIDTVTGTYTLPDSLLSSVYGSNYISHEAGAGYSFRKNNWIINGRLAVESSTLSRNEEFPVLRTMEHSFLYLTGNAVIRYRFSRQKNLNVSYRSNADPPSPPLLQDMIDNSNPLQLSTGNPDLDPSVHHTVTLKYSSILPEKSRVFFVMFAGSSISDYVANRTYFAVSDTLLFGRIPMSRGTLLTRPENMDGYRNVKSFINYGFPLGFIRSNLNLNIQYSHTRRPGYRDQEPNITRNSTTGLGWVLSSNIGEHLDYTLTSRSDYSRVQYSADPENNTRYFIQNLSLRLKGIFLQQWVLETTLDYYLYRGLSGEFDDQSVLWNVGIGKKLFKNRRGEIRLSVYDILRENQDIDRRVSDIYVEDVSSQVLGRYIMLTFSYDLRSFRMPKAPPGRMFRMREGFPRKER